MELSRKAQAIEPSLTLAITAKAKEMKEKGIDVISFSAGEPDFNTPKNIINAAIKAMEDGNTKYTSVNGILQLREAICKKFKDDNGLEYNPSQIVVSTGAKQSLANTFLAILNPGDEVIVSTPYWVSYPELIKLADGKPVFVEGDEKSNYKFTKENLEKAVTAKTKAIVLNTPNNPTGTIYNKEELEVIADFAKKYNIIIWIGAKGGVRFVPHISDEALRLLQQEFCEKLSDPARMLGGNFLYTSDIFFDPEFINKIASVFARKFKDSEADYVATVETKGIPLAASVAHLLNLPLVIIRREAKVSEGSTLSINYFSGSYDRIQRMSMSKRAMRPGSKVLIIDDFMRGGGSISGITEIVGEFNGAVVGVGVAIAGVEPKKKKIEDYTSIVFLGEIDEEKRTISILPNSDIF